MKIAQLASIAGPQSRVAQPETPVTLQFQGNKFTLSHSQLRQLTAGQPLQLQGEGQPAMALTTAAGQAGTVRGPSHPRVAWARDLAPPFGSSPRSGARSSHLMGLQGLW